MVSKKNLQDLIKDIKKKTGKTQQEISSGAGYAEKTLTQLLSKGEDLETVYNQLRIVYSKELNNSTYENNDIAASLRVISKALQKIENGQAYIRAEIRGYGQYQIMESNTVQWDQKKFLKAMEKVGKLVGANLEADDLQGNLGSEDS
jgi:transcriptional regulator with XRE-family HTH domain